MEEKKELLRGNFLPALCEDIPTKFHLKAQTNLNETPEKIEEGLKALRKCIEREKLNLTSDKNFLLMYLRQAKFDLKKAEDKLRSSLKFYTKVEDLVQSCGVERIKAVIDNNFLGMLPFRDAEGRVLLFGQANAWKKELFDMIDAVATLYCLCLFTSKIPLTSICGLCYIGDSTVENIYDLIPMANAFITFVPNLNVGPFRIQRADMINSNFLVRNLWTLVRPFVPSKIRNRVFLSSSKLENLKEAYPPYLLPSEFGGTLGPVNCDSYKERFFEFVENIKSEFRANSN